jgi:hypothetical protein
MILLRLKAMLPEMPVLTPTFQSWKIGADAKEQETLVTMPVDAEEHVTSVTTSSPDVTGTFVKRERNYAVVLKPATTEKATNVIVTIRTSLGRTMHMFASVGP